MTDDRNWWDDWNTDASVVTPAGGMDLVTDGAMWAILWNPSLVVRAWLDEDPDGQILLGSGDIQRIDLGQDLPDYAPVPVNVAEVTWAWALQYIQDVGQRAGTA